MARGRHHSRHADHQNVPKHAECPPLFKAQCGDDFKFDRSFMAWLKDGSAKTMGVAADEWLRRRARFDKSGQT